MLLHIPQVLDATELQAARALLSQAAWAPGESTAGTQAVLVKYNEQLPYNDDTARSLQGLVLKALDRHTVFFSATLPKRIFPPMFNRYGGERNTYGNHVDNAVRHAASGQRVRTDVSCTLFLADPQEYDGGDLVIEDTYGTQRVKLPAGDMIIYPGTSVHRVDPVTQGHRLASFFWIESMVRSDEQRRLLFNLDMNIMALRTERGESAATVGLTGTYHNLLRMWADT